MKTDIKIAKHSGIYTMWCSQEVKADMKTVWDFFSSPKNLAKITPSHMEFVITSPVSVDEMFAGQLISYKLKPFPFYSASWVTEITHVVDKKLFVDEQRFGPYAMWHHIHTFDEMENGHVMMKDFVSYKLPFGVFGSVGSGFVKAQVKQIFEHRFAVVEKLFNQQKQTAETV